MYQRNLEQLIEPEGKEVLDKQTNTMAESVQCSQDPREELPVAEAAQLKQQKKVVLDYNSKETPTSPCRCK